MKIYKETMKISGVHILFIIIAVGVLIFAFSNCSLSCGGSSSDFRWGQGIRSWEADKRLRRDRGPLRGGWPGYGPGWWDPNWNPGWGPGRGGGGGWGPGGGGRWGPRRRHHRDSKHHPCVQRVTRTSDWKSCCENCDDPRSDYGCKGFPKAIKACKIMCGKKFQAPCK